MTHQLARDLVPFPRSRREGALALVSTAEPSAARPKEEAPGAGPHHSTSCDRHHCCCGGYTHPVATMVADHKAGCLTWHAEHGGDDA